MKLNRNQSNATLSCVLLFSCVIFASKEINKVTDQEQDNSIIHSEIIKRINAGIIELESKISLGKFIDQEQSEQVKEPISDLVELKKL